MDAKATLIANAASVKVIDVMVGKIGTTVDKKMQAAAPKTRSSVFAGLEFTNARSVNK